MEEQPEEAKRESRKKENKEIPPDKKGCGLEKFLKLGRGWFVGWGWKANSQTFFQF